MLLDDDSQSPLIYAEYNTTNGTENLLINVTSEIVSISVGIQNEQVIRGVRFYGTNQTLMHEDYFAQVEATWTDIETIPELSRIIGFEVQLTSTNIHRLDFLLTNTKKPVITDKMVYPLIQYDT